MLTLMAGRSWADSARIYIDDFSVKQGEEIELKVMVEADVYVTQAQFSIEIPEGFEFVNKGTARRPAYGSNTENSAGLAFSSNMTGSQLNVFLSDADQIGTEEMSGELAVVYIKAKDDARIGEHVFKLTEAVASDEKATRFATPDADVKVKVYKECTISLGVNDAAYGSASITPVQDIYITGTSITVTATPNEGYKFVKWSDGTNDVSTDNPYTAEVTDDMTLMAVFAPNQYTMTFVLDNGEENVVITQDYATELTAPADPTKTGFTFKGWSPEIPATIPASDQTFTAQWERNKYKLTFVVDGAETTSDVLYEDPVTKPEDPTKEGYTFTGWDKEIPATMPAENLTITAQFSINQYTITFVLDNGEENVVMTQDYGTELTAPANPTKEGYTFKGWDKEIPATMPAENLTIKAVYEENETSEIATLLANKSFVDVYTLKGTLVGRRISVDNLNKILNRGVYIIDCVKVFIR